MTGLRKQSLILLNPLKITGRGNRFLHDFKLSNGRVVSLGIKNEGEAYLFIEDSRPCRLLGSVFSLIELLNFYRLSSSVKVLKETPPVEQQGPGVVGSSKFREQNLVQFHPGFLGSLLGVLVQPKPPSDTGLLDKVLAEEMVKEIGARLGVEIKIASKEELTQLRRTSASGPTLDA